MSPSYVNQQITFEVEVARETDVDADATPTLVIVDKDGTVLFTFTGATTPAVTSVGDGVYRLVTSFAAAAEYYYTWSWTLGAVPLSDEGSVAVLLPTSSSSTGKQPAGLSRLSGRLLDLAGRPVPFTSILFTVDAADRRPYVDATAVLLNEVKAVTDRVGDFTVTLPRGATMQVRFPHIDQQYSFDVPDILVGTLFDYLFPHPVTLRWSEWDPVAEEYIPVVLNIDDEREVDVDGVRVAVEAVWSDGTCTVLPPDQSASATLGSIDEEVLTDSVEYELTDPTEAEVEHVPDDELWDLAGYSDEASFMPFTHTLDFLEPLKLVRP